MASWEKDGFVITTDKEFLDLQKIHHFLCVQTYWAKGTSFDLVKKSIDHSSICFGLFEGDPKKEKTNQIGFARAVTDFVRFAYLMDVFIIPEYRGKGLSKWLVHIITEESELKSVGSILLRTFDAHGLYSQYGFQTIPDPEHYMKRMPE